MSKQKVAKKVADAESGTVQFRFRDGSSQTISLAELDGQTIRLLALHGLEQKIGDSYAGAQDAVDEGKATDVLSYTKAQAARVIANLKAAVWATREVGPSRLVIAVAEALGIDLQTAHDRIRLWQDSDNEVHVKKLADAKRHPKVKLVLARLEKEAQERKMRALAGQDGDDSDLADLFADEETDGDEEETEEVPE